VCSTPLVRDQCARSGLRSLGISHGLSRSRRSGPINVTPAKEIGAQWRRVYNGTCRLQGPPELLSGTRRHAEDCGPHRSGYRRTPSRKFFPNGAMSIFSPDMFGHSLPLSTPPMRRCQEPQLVRIGIHGMVPEQGFIRQLMAVAADLWEPMPPLTPGLFKSGPVASDRGRRGTRILVGIQPQHRDRRLPGRAAEKPRWHRAGTTPTYSPRRN
jgi:hypothetical protein